MMRVEKLAEHILFLKGPGNLVKFGDNYQALQPMEGSKGIG